MKNILVTGGAGYIGSHTCIELISSGYKPVIFDNLANSSESTIEKIERIVGKSVDFVYGDIQDTSLVEQTLKKYKCESVIHFAGLKSVEESNEYPLRYYNNNVVGTLSLLDAMKSAETKKLIFSSSATVYGHPIHLPINETHPLAPVNPYGRTKLIVEEILRDLFRSDSHWSIIILRYFNPVGAHESGLIGENPLGQPNNLVPYIAQVAKGIRPHLNVFGSDYSTSDGSGVRDYIHVNDLARGHTYSLNMLKKPQCCEINLGTGKGISVLDVVREYEKVSKSKIPYIFAPRRKGDVDSCYADATKASLLLKWKPKYDIAKMCEDDWNWQSKLK